MKPMVSVIVPVYNAGRPFGAVSSILDQQYTDLELLLVNDGSTDASGEICDEFAARDARVTVLHQKRRCLHRPQPCPGAGTGHLSNFWTVMTGSPQMPPAPWSGRGGYRCDLVIADFHRVVGAPVPKKATSTRTAFSLGRNMPPMMENPADFYYGVLWNKLYRRELVERYHLRMDPEISWCEDFYSI